MENKALQRLEAGLAQLLDLREKAGVREQQLSAALAKSGDDAERLKAENFQYRTERSDTRKRLDAVISDVDKLVASGAEAAE